MASLTPLRSLASAKKAVATGSVLLLLAGTFSTLLLAQPEATYAIRTQCSDGKDNDTDGKTDYPEDDNCEDLDDDFEGISRSGTFVTLTDGRKSASAGSSVTYQVTLRQQRDSQRDVNVVVHFPPQIDLVSASDGGRITTDGNVRWDNVTLTKDNVRTLTVQAGIRTNAPIGTLLVAQANAQGETATDTTLIEDLSEDNTKGRFRLWLSDGETTIQQGDRLDYTLRVRNDTNVTQTTDVRAILSSFLGYVGSSTGGQVDRSDNIVWKSITFNPGEERNFTFSASVQTRISDDILIRTRALAAGATAYDDTSIRMGLPHDALSIHISDGRETVKRGDVLTYEVELRNGSTTLGTEEFIAASLPLYSEFVDVTEGGYWDGKNVRWQNLQIAPNGVRTLTYKVRVRSDAPLGTEMLATVQTDGSFDADHTHVAKVTSEGSDPFGGKDPSESTRNHDNLLLRKIAAGDEAMPGSAVRFNIYVKNVFDHVIDDAVITDRFETTYLRFNSSETAGAYDGSSTLTFRVPSLAPGETWQTSYLLDVAQSAPQGTVLTNMATIAGSDVETLPLTQRVRTVRIGVLMTMPQTGAGLDTIASFLGITLALGLGAAQSLRRGALLA